MLERPCLLSWLLVVPATMLASCGGSPDLTCGPGTHADDTGTCVIDATCGPGTHDFHGVCLPHGGGGGGGGSALSCGPGTTQLGDTCVPAGGDGGGGASATSVSSTATGGGPSSSIGAGGSSNSSTTGSGVASSSGTTGAGGGGGSTSEALNFAIDAAHSNAQPNDVVASPLAPTWTAQFSGAVSYPLVVGGSVIVAAAESQPNVRALDLATGQVVWGPVVMGGAVTLAAHDGAVFALDGNGHVKALDAASGTPLWTKHLTVQLFYWGPPVAAGGSLFVNGLESGGTTIALDAQTGATLWTANTFDGSEGGVAVANGVVYEAEACDQLSAFDATTGHRNWFHQGNCTGGGGSTPAVHASLVWERDWAMGDVIIDVSGHDQGAFAADSVPAFHGGTVFYTKSGALSAVDIATSTLKWTFTGDDQLCTSAVVAGGGVGQVFIGSSSGKVFEIDETTGQQTSVHDIGAPVTQASEIDAMSLAGGHLLVPAGNELVVY